MKFIKSVRLKWYNKHVERMQNHRMLDISQRLQRKEKGKEKNRRKFEGDVKEV